MDSLGYWKRLKNYVENLFLIRVFTYVLEHIQICCILPLNLLIYFCCSTETPPKSNVVETTDCYEGKGEGYRGTVDVMPTGLTCQRWDSQYPHNHTFVPEAYPCKWVTLSHKTCIHLLTHLHALIADYWMNFSVFSRDLRENYCRNPDGQEFPWCFTTDPRVRTMFCTNIPQCGTQNKPNGERLNSLILHLKQQRKSRFSLHLRQRTIPHFHIFWTSEFTWEPVTTHIGL